MGWMSSLKLFMKPVKVFPRERPAASVVRPKFYVGTWIIGCPKQWADMAIGQVVGHCDGVEIIFDLISEQQLEVNCPAVEYSARYLAVLAKMTPIERFEMLAHQSKPGPKLIPTATVSLWSESQYQERVREAGLPV